ncbi:MAG: ATP-binding protein [Anaerolineae bacterium]|nr:ATP-binding protein [Anaerolineae bacterium]
MISNNPTYADSTGRPNTPPCLEPLLTALDINSLRQVIIKEVLPLLEVEQFAMLRLSEDKLPLPVITANLSPADLPTSRQIIYLLEKPENCTDNRDCPDWIKFIVALQTEKRLLAVWLLGESKKGGAVLDYATFLSRQATLALINIEQANHLRSLYMAGVERQELENKTIAEELQREVLNPLALLNDSLDPMDTPHIVTNAYQSSMQTIRALIGRLYPIQQNYDLYSGLVTLVESLQNLRVEEMVISLNIPDTNVNFSPDIEVHLYRIIQQACQNAIQHSRASSVQITGSITSQYVEINVIDDGVGFIAPAEITLPELLVNHHFGLASMYERAELIGAGFKIETAPNRGCRVSITWQSHPDEF